MIENSRLDALYTYIEEQMNRADITEEMYNILQFIQDELGNVLYD